MTNTPKNRTPVPPDFSKTVELASPVKLPQSSAVWSSRGTKPMSFGSQLTKEGAKEKQVIPKVTEEQTQLTARAEMRIPRKRVGRPPIVEADAAKSISRSGKLALLAQQSQAEMLKTAVIAHKPENLGIQELLDKSEECLETGDLLTADSLLTVAIAKGVYDARKERAWKLSVEVGSGFYLANQFIDARTAYRRSCNLFPDRLISQFNLGTAALMTGDFQGALECFLKANELEGGEPKVLCNMGAAYFLQDKSEEAEPLLREAVRLRPDYIRALNTLSSVLGAMNRLNESLEVCNQVLELSPEHPEASFKKGVIELSRGELEEAVTCFEIATASPILHCDSKCFMALAFVAGSQPAEAEKLLLMSENEEHINNELLATTWKAIGACWKESDDTERALLAYRLACDLVPSDATAWLELGQLYEKLSENAFAQTCFQTYSEIQAQGLSA